jgi:hypothetical protein
MDQITHDKQINDYLDDIRSKSTKVTLDKERSLDFSLEVMADLEEEFGSIEKAFELLGNMSAKAIKKILFFCLKQEDEFLTEKQVATMIPFNRLVEIATKLTDAMGASLGSPNEEGPEVKKPVEK